MSDAYMPKSESVEWGTPRHIFAPIHNEFGFTLDCAAAAWNTKVPERWFSKDVDGLVQSWYGETVWCNPPYGSKNIAEFLAKAHAERERKATTVLLLPNTTDCRWFHDHVWDITRNRTRQGVEMRFFSGRISFEVPPEMRDTVKSSSNVKGSILVIVRPSIVRFTMCPTCGHAAEN